MPPKAGLSRYLKMRVLLVFVAWSLIGSAVVALVVASTWR